MSLVKYPDVLPAECFTLLLEKVQGKDVPVSELVNAAWNVAGFGLGKWFPTPNDSFGSVSEEFALKAIIEQIESDNAQGVISGIIVGVVIKLALKILAEYVS